MDAVATILTNAGWRRDADHCPKADHPPRACFSKGRARAYVGPKFATFYTKVSEGNIDNIRSVRNDDATAVQGMAATR